MKKIAAGILALSLVVCAIPKAEASTKVPNNDIKVIVNSKTLQTDQKPIIKNGRVLVPMRAIFDELGATVEWNPRNQTIRATEGYYTLDLTIGSKQVIVNNKGVIALDVEAQIVNGRTMVPLRFVSQSFGADVSWDQGTKTAQVTSVKAESKPYILREGAVGYHLVDLYELDDLDAISDFADFVISKGYPMEKEELIQLVKERGHVYEDNFRFYEAFIPHSSVPSWIRVEWK